jgi:outer membrane beta-barrel protein
LRTTLLAVLALVPSLAWAQAEQLENPGSVSAVQERQYRMNHELSVGVGVLPLDAFYKGYTAEVAYTFHFTDAFAWQIGRFAYSYNVDTGLKSQLLTQYGVLPTTFPEVQWMVGSDLIWSPLYGKWSFLNRSVIHFEGYLLGGVSVLDLNNQSSGSLPFKPALNVGVGVRVFTTKRVSFKLDFTNNVVFATPIFNVPTIQLAAALNFGATE